MRWVKHTLLILGGLAVLGLVLIVSVLFILDNDDYRRLAIRGVAHFTGYRLTIEGPFRLELSTAPLLSAEDIRIDPEPDGPLPPVSKIGKFKIQIALWPLFKGIVVIKELQVADVVGAVIIRTPAESEERSDSARNVPPDIKIPIMESVRLRNIHLDVIDEAADRTIEVRLAQFEIDSVRDSGPLFVSGRGSVNGQDIKLDGKLGALSAIFKGAQPYPVYLNVSTTDFNLSANGTIEDLLDGEGIKLHLAAETGELSHLFQLLQIEVPPLGHLRLKATVIHDFSAPGLADLHVSLTGDARIELALDGFVENMLSGQGANIRFSGLCASPDIFQMLLPAGMPTVNQIRVAGEIRETEGALAVENLEFDAALDQGLTLKADGRIGLHEIGKAPAITETALNVALSTPTTELLKSHTIESLPEMGPVTAQARLTGPLEQLSLEDIAVEAGRAGAVRITSRGRIGRLPAKGDMIISEIDLTASMEVQNTRLLTSGLGVEVPDLGSVAVHSRIRGSSNQFQLAEIDARMTNAQGLTAGVSGNIDLEQHPVDGLVGNMALGASIEAPTLLAALAPLGITDLPDLKPLRVRAEIAGTTRALSLEKVALSVGGSSAMRVEVTGRVGRVPLPADQPISDVNMKASFFANTTAALSTVLGVTVPDCGSLKATGHITDRNGIYGLRDIIVSIKDSKKTTIKVKGNIEQVIKGYELAADGINLQASISEFSLKPFSELLGRPLPDFGSLRGAFRLAGSQTELAVSRLRLSTNSPQGMRMTVSGEIARVSLAGENPLEGVALAVSAKALQLAEIPGLEGLNLPELGPLQIQAAINDRHGYLGVETFNIRSGDGKNALIHIYGNILRIDDLEQMRFQANVETTSQPWIATYLQRTPAKNYQLSGAITITGSEDGLNLNELRLGAAEDTLLVMRADGRLFDLSTAPQIDLRFDASATDPAAVGSMLGVSLPLIGPLAINGRIKGVRPTVTFEGKIRIGETSFTSTAGIDLALPRPRIDARLAATIVNLNDLGIYPQAPPQPTAAAARPKPRKRAPLFDDTPLSFEALKTVDLDFTLDVDRLVARNTTIDKVDFDIRLENGRLRIYPAALTYAAGTTELDIIVDASGSTPEFTFKISGEDIDIGNMLGHAHQPMMLSGDLNLSADLHTTGRSVREIAANLDGEFSLALENGRIRRIVYFLSMDAFDLVFTTADRRQFTDLQCLVNKTTFEKGVGTIEIFSMDTPNMRVGGAGYIDLGAERIDLAINPIKKKRAFRSRSAIQITGPLANPKVRTIPGKEAAALYGKILMPYVFLPARALDKLVGLLRTDKDVTGCQFK